MLLTTPSVVSINVDGATTTNSTASWTVTFSEPVTGVDPTDFSLVRTGSVGDTLTQIKGSGSTYTLTASHLSGNGTLGLNLVDNDSIVNSTGVPLGGVGLGNGNLTGQVVTVENTFPSVTSIDRTSPSGPTTNASSVTYTVNFSEAVTGVDVTDFSVLTTGTLATTGTMVSSIDTSTYTVTINGITGLGTLSLDLVDNGGIHDLAGNPLRNPNLPNGFGNPVTYGSGGATQSPNVADLNGDGKLDLVAANVFGQSESVLLGNGDGTFQSPKTGASQDIRIRWWRAISTATANSTSRY